MVDRVRRHTNVCVSDLPLITIGAVRTGFGTGLLLPTLLTWAA
jgi:hypothetical protein